MESSKQTPENRPQYSEAEAKAIDALADRFHENWRTSRILEDGSCEPQIKSTKDETWIEANNTDQIDIANTNYADLPKDWQAENKAAAEAVIKVMVEHDGHINLANDAVRSAVGNKIHEAWLSRNEWAKGGELDVTFDELPVAEKNKDLDQIVLAKSLFLS